MLDRQIGLERERAIHDKYYCSINEREREQSMTKIIVQLIIFVRLIAVDIV